MGEVAPVRERGLKSGINTYIKEHGCSRSREGAWIEISMILAKRRALPVAPVRERGLKWGRMGTPLERERSLP